MGLYQQTTLKRLSLAILIILAFPIAYFTYTYTGERLDITSPEMQILVGVLMFTILMTVTYVLIRFIYWIIDGFQEKEE